MSQPVVHGPGFSTYVRSVRLALHEKGVEHKLEEVDFINGAHKQPPHINRQPFAKVPAFEHAGNAFYETPAILRYIDEVFSGPSLTPSTPIERAKMTQVISIVDSYGYQPAVHGLFIPRVFVPMLGGKTDEAKVEASKEPAALFVQELSRLLGNGQYFASSSITLADLHVFPVLTYLAATPEGQAILEKHANIRSWFSRIGARPSVKAIMPPS
jgi:glutathione S-transferase